MKKIISLLVILIATSNYTYSQCATTSNIYSFVYDGKTYEVVKENQTWTAAAACAVERGGILAEINDSLEQDAIFNELNTNAGIVLANTVASDGGGASYVWLGGNDFATEGNWVWDGNNVNETTQFWMGIRFTGNVVGGLYNNWGNEPDDFNSNQDGLAIGLTQWPINNGSLGSAGQWNDINDTNTIYYLIEYGSLGISKYELEKNIKVFPNPATNTLNISNSLAGNTIKKASIINSLGQKIPIEIQSEVVQKQIDISNLSKGVYFIHIQLEDNSSLTKKFIKE
jgi:hypothetical protein